MLSLLASPLGRAAIGAAALAAVGAWGALERAGRINAGLRLEAAQHALAAAEARIRNMEARNAADDAANATSDPAAVLQEHWRRDP